METVILAIAIAALAASLAAVALVAAVYRRLRSMGKDEGKTVAEIKESLRSQTESVNANTALLLNGYVANLDGKTALAEARQQATSEQTLKQLGEMAERMRQSLREQRLEMEQKLDKIRADMDAKQRQNIEMTAARLDALRQEVAGQLGALREENNKQLDRMRKVVDQELQENLQVKLTQSFQLISDNLAKVYTTMGEMQAIGTDMNDLKRVLSGVKTRGVWGEASLAGLLAEVLMPEQYEANFRPSMYAQSVVEFAVRLPGKREGESVYLPIDSKFPREDYERLVNAADRGDKEGVEAAAKALERRVKEEAKDVRDKYIKPPRTTDFAVLYVPIEGLFAEIMRREGLGETLRNEYRVMVAGPTTLAALLNSLQMGFKTLAVEKRSKEIWDLLAVVQKQFRRFAGDLERAERQLDTAARTLHETGERTRRINVKLSSVQQLDGRLAAADDTDDTEE